MNRRSGHWRYIQTVDATIQMRAYLLLQLCQAPCTEVMTASDLWFNVRGVIPTKVYAVSVNTVVIAASSMEKAGQGQVNSAVRTELKA